MIRVLQSLEEVQRAIRVLQKSGCGYHSDPIKNWDMAQINEILEGSGKDIYVLDMGCGFSQVLKFLHKKGLTRCFGIDLSTSLSDILTLLGFMIKEKTIKTPYKLVRGDLTKTSFPNNSFDIVICLSVIEHGVNVNSFLKEASRVLKSNGILYVSTDYWEPKILTNDVPKPYGLDWNIFSEKEIQSLINIAKKYNLRMGDENIPPTKDKVVHWNKKDFTFISLIFKKE